MKKLYTILAVVLLTATTFAQAPEKMSYQAVVRCSDDVLVSNLPVGMQISILQTTATGTAVYVETQRPTTNVNGLVSLEIGTGTTTDDFSTIDWSTGPYFIKIETDPEGGSDYTITGTSQLLSVPYALYAKTAENAFSGDYNDLTNQPTLPTGTTYTVNTFYPESGGYVIEINTDGTHGLVAAMQDQGVSDWYSANNLLSDAANHDANGAKFKDWRMPTKRELNLIYMKKSSIGGFTNAWYWSSSEVSENNAWRQGFGYGYQSSTKKRGTYDRVRAVRAF